MATTSQRTNTPRKLSGNCLDCRAPLTSTDMALYLRLCERTGRNPLDAPKGAILCIECLAVAIDRETPEEDAAAVGVDEAQGNAGEAVGAESNEPPGSAGEGGAGGAEVPGGEARGRGGEEPE